MPFKSRIINQREYTGKSINPYKKPSLVVNGNDQNPDNDVAPVQPIGSGQVSDGGCSQNFWSCYDPDAILWGASLSGSEPGVYNTGGLEEIFLFANAKRATFIYGGQGSSYGGGASAAAYGGLILNLKDPDDYKGPFGTAGFTVSILEKGVTVFYFWDSSKSPLSPRTTQGIGGGYAPGAQASVWWASTIYSFTWRSDK